MPPSAGLTTYERLSFAVVRLIRSPWFIGWYTLGTLAWWLSHPPANGWANAFRDDAYPWPLWTSAASLLALWIESAVGVGQYLQQKRDAIAAERQAAMMRAIATQTNAIAEALGTLRRIADALLTADERDAPAEATTRALVHEIVREFRGFRQVAEQEYGRRRQADRMLAAEVDLIAQRLEVGGRGRRQGTHLGSDGAHPGVGP